MAAQSVKVHTWSEVIKLKNGVQFAVTICGQEIHYQHGLQNGELSAWPSDVTCRSCKRDATVPVLEGQTELFG